MPQTKLTTRKSTIESQLSDARKARSIRKIKELEHLLFISKAQNGKPIQDIRAMVSRSFRRISDVIDSDLNQVEKQQSIAGVFRELNQRATGETRQILQEISHDVIESSRLNFEAIATPEMKRALTGLPNDSRGLVKPQPKQVARIEDEGLSLPEILLIASPLLVLAGIEILDRINPASREVIGDENDVDLQNELVNFTNPGVSASILDKLQRIMPQSGPISTSIIIDMENLGPVPAKEAARKELERVGNGIANEIRHEALKQKGRQSDRILDTATADVLIGYTLHSRFLATTDPVHAANDGNKYFRDDRRGSTAPWAERLVPPYRKNCVCFQIEIWENPLGDVFSTEFDAIPRRSGARRLRPSDIGARVYSLDDGGFITVTQSDVGRLIRSREDWELITPRDVGTWARWFDDQRPGIRRTLMGLDRYESAFQRRGSVPGYSDFIDGRGRILSRNAIAGESEGERLVRLERSRTTIEAQERFHREAWERGGNKWDMDPAMERRYKRRLEQFLKRVL